MTEDEALAWCEARYDPASLQRLRAYATLLVDGASQQNLIAASSIPTLWSRHIVDSAQLLGLMQPGSIVDIGSGAGLPGLVLACLGREVTLVEPRKRRVEFLQYCINTLELGTAVQPVVAQRAGGQFANITARAVASPERLIKDTLHLAGKNTRWILPAGKTAFAIDHLPRVFHVEQSVTDASAGIIIAEAKGTAK